MALERNEEAVGQYSSVLGYSENNLVALNNLAWLLQDTEPKEALKYSKLAHELSPDTAGLMDTYAVLLLKNGMPKKGLLIARRALEKSPNNPSIQYHMALALEANKKRDDAISMLSSTLSDGVNFPERAEAETMLEKLR